MLAGAALAAAPEGEITVWCMGSEGMRIPELARAFEREHPGTRIRTQAVPWNGAHDRLVTAVAGGVAPDLTQLGSTWVPEFAAMGALAPLDARLDAPGGPERTDFFEGAMATARWRGETVALPWYVDVRVVFYRADLLAEAGWDRYPRDWAELERMAEELTRDLDGDGETDRYALNLPARDETALLCFVWQAGGRLLDPALERSVFDAPATREAFAFYDSLFERGFSPAAEMGQIDPFQAFRDGFFVSWISGPWMVGEYERRLPELAGRWRVAPLPAREREASFLGGSQLAMMKTSRNPELAWAFLEYLSRAEVQREWYRLTGDLPALRAAWEAPEFAGSETWSVFRRQLETARPVPPVECWEAMAESVKNGMEEMIVGERSPEATVAGIDADFAGILERRKVGPGNLSAAGPWLAGGLLVLALAGAGLLGRGWWRARRAYPDLRTPAFFLAPILAHLSVFLFLPILASLFLSFTDADIYALGDWRRGSVVGLENYGRLLGDGLFWRAVGNTLYFVVIAGPATIALALGAALLLNRPRLPGRAFFRTGFFLPVVTPLVAIAVVWRWIYSPRAGLLNWALEALGLPGQDWLADPALAMPCLIAMAVWKNFGYSMVIFLAGLQAIPTQLYEASDIDGAGAWQRLTHITLPLLKPTTVFVTIITTIGYMQLFAEPYIMTDMGGPRNATLSVVLYLYKEGFKFFNLGYASAMAYALCLAIALLSVVQLRWARTED